MPVAVLVQAVQKALPGIRQQRFPVKEDGSGLQRGVFATVQDVVQVEPKQTVVGPLAALE